MLSVITTAVTLALTIGAGAAPFTAEAALDSPTRHVRTADRVMRKLLKTGFHDSPTFAALMARLEQSDVIVYLEDVPRLPGALEGRLVIMPLAHGFRYVRVQVAQRGAPADTIAIIGHELRHAVEVAEAPDVHSEADLAALYRRIGINRGNNLFDTTAAQETGRRVWRELTA